MNLKWECMQDRATPSNIWHAISLRAVHSAKLNSLPTDKFHAGLHILLKQSISRIIFLVASDVLTCVLASARLRKAMFIAPSKHIAFWTTLAQLPALFPARSPPRIQPQITKLEAIAFHRQSLPYGRQAANSGHVPFLLLTARIRAPTPCLAAEITAGSGVAS